MVLTSDWLQNKTSGVPEDLETIKIIFIRIHDVIEITALI